MEKEGQAGIEVFLGLSWPCAPPVASFQVDENVDRYFFDNVGDVVVELLGEPLFPVNTQPKKHSFSRIFQRNCHKYHDSIWSSKSMSNALRCAIAL